MTLHIPPEHWQCKLRWGLAGDPEEVVSTIGVRGHEGGGRPAEEVAEAVWSAWDGAWAPGTLSPTWTFLGCDVTEGSTAGDGVVASHDQAKVGTGTWSCLPSNCAILVKKRTALGGRMNVGRMFLPGGYIDEAGTSPTGELNSTAFNAYTDRMIQFWQNLDDTTTEVGQPITDFYPVLFHTDPARAPTNITHFSVDRVIATQRQRMRR